MPAVSTAAGIPVGGLLWYLSATASANFIALTGGFLNRSSYPELWTSAQTPGMLVTDAAWLAANGPLGCFSQGNGSTTFRLPRLGGHFLRMWVSGQVFDSARTVGSRQGDVIRNITGNSGYAMAPDAGNTNLAGAFKMSASNTYGWGAAAGIHVAGAFNVSLESPLGYNRRRGSRALSGIGACGESPLRYNRGQAMLA